MGHVTYMFPANGGLLCSPLNYTLSFKYLLISYYILHLLLTHLYIYFYHSLSSQLERICEMN